MRTAAHGGALLAALLVACSQPTDVFLGADDALSAPPANGSTPPPASPPQTPPVMSEPPPPPSAENTGGGTSAGDLVIDSGAAPEPADAAASSDAAPAEVDAAADAAVDAGPPPSLVCANGTADCDGDPSNGCEADTDTDLQNCGGCARLCHTNGHDAVSASCVDGRCVLTCRDDGVGDNDCDGDPDNGCETSLMTDRDNCGACGNACFFGLGWCLNGRCGI